MQPNVIIIACSIFKYELEYLKSQHRLDVPVVYLNSMLHMHPKKLQELLDAKIAEYEHYKIILLFGDCHARMVDYEKKTDISRAQGINCCEIFLGSEKYRKMRNDGAFILLPEWSIRWKEAFVDYMGFNTSKSAQFFMTDMHKKLVYVDTGFQDINQSLLDEISEYVGLPLEIYHTSIAELENVLNSLINSQKNKE